jgi:hypothetical protein
MSGSNSKNESGQAGEQLDPVVLDRLVDGELPEAERRKLLVSLDQRPSGWRQCALAFLEAQSWRDLFPSAAKNLQAERKSSTVAAAVENAEAQLAAGAVEGESSVELARPQHRAAPRWLWMVEMAAGFLIALSLGFYLRGGFLGATAQQNASVVQSNRIPGNLNETANGRVQDVSVPLVDPRQVEAWRAQPMVNVPDEVRRAAENTGFQIRQVRKYLQVQVPGGQAVVPIDQIEIIPAGNRGMQ